LSLPELDGLDVLPSLPLDDSPSFPSLLTRLNDLASLESALKIGLVVFLLLSLSDDLMDLVPSFLTGLEDLSSGLEVLLTLSFVDPLP